MIYVFATMMIMIGLMFHFQPIIDKNDQGQRILTYRLHRKTKERKYIKLW
jgi:hypothetical protein